MKVKEIMVKVVVTCSEKDSVQEVAKLMDRKDIGSVIVLRSKKPVGIVTERDMTYKVVADELDSTKTKVKDVMSSPIIFVEPERDINHVDLILQRNNIKRLPVISNGKVIGIITQSDLIKRDYEERKGMVATFSRGLG